MSEEIYRKIIQIDRGTVYSYKYNKVYYLADFDN